jgi:hypothetical protein
MGEVVRFDDGQRGVDRRVDFGAQCVPDPADAWFAVPRISTVDSAAPGGSSRIASRSTSRPSGCRYCIRRCRACRPSRAIVTAACREAKPASRTPRGYRSPSVVRLRRSRASQLRRLSVRPNRHCHIVSWHAPSARSSSTPLASLVSSSRSPRARLTRSQLSYMSVSRPLLESVIRHRRHRRHIRVNQRPTSRHSSES